MSVNKSLYEEFIISSGDGSTTVDIAAGVVNFTYYENLFSPVITILTFSDVLTSSLFSSEITTFTSSDVISSSFLL